MTQITILDTLNDQPYQSRISSLTPTICTSVLRQAFAISHNTTQSLSPWAPRSWRKNHCEFTSTKNQDPVLLTMFPCRAVASAVILPESERPPSPPANLKRRQSSFSDERSKRPRLSQNDSNGSRPSTMTPQQSASQDTQQSDRRRSGQMEERKRGQRLFGALLGTLSQSSSSTAQKRRTDIERKQQAKLKLQAEEQDEKKKQKLEALLVVRRREQRKFDKQSVCPTSQRGVCSI